jgi:L-Lysine epsilon oxidase N-terminal
MAASNPDTQIVRAAIYPPIGVARVGNSEDEFFLAPEVPDPLPEKPGFYRDAAGALKRQAARFRIYGINAAGVAVRELTADDAKIEWQVHLANKKSSWFQFQLALDIPEAADAPPTLLRNATVSDRAALNIDPGPRKVSGKNQKGRKYTFDSGKFMGTPVYLGELRTDEAGRVIVLADAACRRRMTRARPSPSPTTKGGMTTPRMGRSRPR